MKTPCAKMKEECTVPLRARRVSLPEKSGQVEGVAFLLVDMRRTFEDPEFLRNGSEEDSEVLGEVVRDRGNRPAADDYKYKIPP